MEIIVMFFLLTFFAWVMIVLGIRTERENSKKAEKERSLTTGRIVRYDEVEESRRGRTVIVRFPVIAYSAGSRLLEMRSDYSEDPDKVPVGTIVDVYYDPDAPEHFHLFAGDTFRRGGRNLIRIGTVWVAAVLVFFLVLGTMSGRFSFHKPRFLAQLEWQLQHFASRSRSAEPTDIPVTEPTNAPDQQDEPEPVKKLPDYMAMPGEFEYTVRDGTAILTRFTAINQRRRYLLEIPDEIEGYTVTGLLETTFPDTVIYSEVRILGTIQMIPAQCFARWVFLSAAEMEPGVQEIGQEAFAGNRLLSRVILPDTVTHIAGDAFADNCKATFVVDAGSYAEQFCREKGYKVEIRTATAE
ncbi:MAG: DUF3592 domain-containing protein [Clostridia bacterium]|nr:DUF3592 domain-containing protein [Clostridia bacterium]